VIQQIWLFVADDEDGACSLSPAQDLSCIRILPEINDVLPVKEPCDSLPNNSDSFKIHDDSGVSCSEVCRKQDLDCHADVDTATVSDKLPCGTHWTDVDNLTVADIHATDHSPQKKLLPSLCDTNPTSGNCDNPANADGSLQEKLLPSLRGRNPTSDNCDNLADADSQPMEKLLPSLSDET